MVDIIPQDSGLVVGTTPVEVLPEMGISLIRSVFTITNTSTAGQTISLGFAKNAVAGSGVVLGAGGSYSEARDPSFLPFQGRITAIADAAAGSLAVSMRLE